MTKETRPYVRLTCCWVGDERIALCPLHAAAPEMLEFIRKASALPTGDEWPYPPAMVTAARALLARIDAEPRR